MSVSGIGNINYINQNQGVAIDNLAKHNAKMFADEQITLITPEVKVIEESSESAKTNTNLDEENLDQESHNKKEQKNEQKKASFFGVEIEDEEIEEDDNKEKIFDKLV